MLIRPPEVTEAHLLLVGSLRITHKRPRGGEPSFSFESIDGEWFVALAGLSMEKNREIDGREKCLFGLCNTTNVISYIILICLSYKKAKAKDIMFTQKVAVMQRRRLMGASCLRCNVMNRCIGSNSAKDSNTVDTYYDSQSGQHVAMHDESKISVYLRGNNVSFDELVAQKMRPLKKNTSKTKYYKERAGLIREARSAMLQTAKDMGMAGSIISLPPQQIHPDDRAKPPTIEWKQQIMSSSYDTLPDYINSIGSNNVFLHLPPHRHDLLFTSEKSNEEELSTITIPSNINLCFEYGCNDDDELSNNIQRTLDNYDDTSADWVSPLKSVLFLVCNTPVLKYTGILLHYRPHDNKLNACRQCRHVGADMPTVPTCRADSADTADSDDKCRHICRRVGTVGTVGSKCRHNN